MRIPIPPSPAAEQPPRELTSGGRLGFGPARSGSGTALILLAFVMLPAAVLGYLSWRAIERERADSLEQLRGSYRQLAALAARQVDSQLRSVESRWMGAFEGLMSASARGPRCCGTCCTSIPRGPRSGACTSAT